MCVCVCVCVQRESTCVSTCVCMCIIADVIITVCARTAWCVHCKEREEKREVFFLVPTTSQRRQAQIDKPKPVSIIYQEKNHMSAAVYNLLNSRINAKISSTLYACVFLICVRVCVCLEEQKNSACEKRPSVADGWVWSCHVNRSMWD